MGRRSSPKTSYRPNVAKIAGEAGKFLEGRPESRFWALFEGFDKKTQRVCFWRVLPSENKDILAPNTPREKSKSA